MLDLQVIEEPVAASLTMDPIKARILAELRAPASAAALAPRVGLTRQKVNYHLKALEEHKLVEPAESRQWGGITERVLVASASTYIISPAALGDLAPAPERRPDKLLASYVVALASRMVQEVGRLWRRSHEENKRLFTFSLDTVIRFRSPAERTAFTEELTQAVSELASRYHAEQAGARPHRLVVAAYPAPQETSHSS
ncbi:MAG: helix-turn-helix domain-containing protein [Verrucomicrobiota bacterium JB022]|nr:helix-turn-helix domain-containing protein [Verrucomicrobiota bacterium JB022]